VPNQIQYRHTKSDGWTRSADGGQTWFFCYGPQRLASEPDPPRDPMQQELEESFGECVAEDLMDTISV